MNRGQLVARISQTLGLAATAQDSAEELQAIRDVVNEAVVDILSRTKVYVKTTTITLEPNVDEYDLADPILKILELRSGTTALQEVSEGDIDQTGTFTFATVGYNRLKFGWFPEADLTAWYTPRPTEMGDDAHDPATASYGLIPEEFHGAIVTYACWWLADMVGDVGSGRGEKYRVLYEGKLGLGELGSQLGRIKLASNRRAASGSSQHRRRRQGEWITSDVNPNYWTG